MSGRKWDLQFLDMAKLVSSWSKDPSTRTGAVITRPDRTVVSVGFNGFPMSMPDDPAFLGDREEKYSRVIHCEINALLFSREPLNGYSLYTYPFLSCERCAVTMIQAGIKRLVAPVAAPDKLERWGKSFEKTRRYCGECHVEVAEIEYETKPSDAPEPGDEKKAMKATIIEIDDRLMERLASGKKAEFKASEPVTRIIVSLKEGTDPPATARTKSLFFNTFGPGGLFDQVFGRRGRYL